MNYKSAPSIKASATNIGTGFRGKGNISASALTVQGFSITDAGVVSGAAPTSSETFGVNDNTDGNSIMYRSTASVKTEAVRTQLASPVTVIALGSVTGINVGDSVTVSPPAVPFSNSAVTVSAINATANTVTLSAAWTPGTATAYTATFTRPTVATAPAEYDAATKRFYATIPVQAASSGSGAAATLEFTPTPVGYRVSSSSVTVNAANWMKYKNYDGTMTPYLYGQYWEGSDYDKQNSQANANYAGLQASGDSYVLGYSGTIGKKRADVYWPDYSKISVWFCTGTYSGSRSQWTRADVAVTTEGTGNSQAKVLTFQLKPAAKSRVTTLVNGSLVTSDYVSAAKSPDAVPPTVKLYLTDCPDSWVVPDDYSRPTSIKEGNPDRLPWWSPSSGAPRPIVDIVPLGQAVGPGAVNIIDGGKGWAKGTIFAFKLFMSNPYDQYVDYNTATVEPSIRKSHTAYEGESSYRACEFVLTASTPDISPQHGPPNTLIEPCALSTPGTGYTAGQAGSIVLLKRNVGSTAAVTATLAAAQSKSITWTAKTLDTLSAASINSIASVTVLSQGRNYVGKPTIEVRSTGNGYGLEVEPVVVNGKIESVNVINPGTATPTNQNYLRLPGPPNSRQRCGPRCVESIGAHTDSAT